MRGNALRCDHCGAVEFESHLEPGRVDTGRWIMTLRSRLGEEHFCSPECAIESFQGVEGFGR